MIKRIDLLKKSVRCLVMGVAMIVLNGVVESNGANAQDETAEEQDNRLFELRIYTTHEGKLNDLHDRFRNHTNGLFEKHGMELIGYWTPSEGEEANNTLIYILAYPDREARDASWQGFLNDPDWRAAFAASREDGPIVSNVESTFMNPTTYSAIK